MEHDIVIDPDGSVRFIYADEVAEVFAGEAQETKRASHVEPYRSGWIADMTPSGGPVLGASGPAHLSELRPFPTRQAALDAELTWLRKERGL